MSIYDLWFVFLFILWYFYGDDASHSSSVEDKSEAPPSNTNSFSSLWSSIEEDLWNDGDNQ